MQNKTTGGQNKPDLREKNITEVSKRFKRIVHPQFFFFFCPHVISNLYDFLSVEHKRRYFEEHLHSYCSWCEWAFIVNGPLWVGK